jgi:hypothetical protein
LRAIFIVGVINKRRDKLKWFCRREWNKAELQIPLSGEDPSPSLPYKQGRVLRAAMLGFCYFFNRGLLGMLGY